MGRGGLIGFLCGAMPGAGATIAAFISYGLEKKISKHPEKFGNGAIEGIACTETANNAASAGAMVPLLGLGIPGSSTTAVLLTGFIMFGLQPGPTLFTSHPDIVWPLIASMYIGNVMLVLMCLLGVSVFIWLVQKSIPFLTPLIVGICIAGAFATNNWIRDVWIMAAFGIVAYILSLLEFPMVNVLLGLILGKDMEFNFIKSVLLADGDMTTFFRRPISATLIIVSVLLILFPALKGFVKKMIQRTGKA
jgi:putative tricarboxylic transport membrane protein